MSLTKEATNSWLIVLNWNGRDDTLALLDSLEQAELPSTTVLVVDNDSADGSLEAVRQRHPGVRTLQTGANLGYAGGNNRAIELALSEGADVIGVLNNDTLVDPDFWVHLIAVAAQTDTAVSPDIRYADNPTVSWFLGSTIDKRSGWVRHLQPAEQPPRQGLVSSPTLTGCCLVASADVWTRVGRFDEGLFLIFEDADWSMRARACGVDLLIETKSRIQHKVSRSFQTAGTGTGTYYYARNGFVFARRWFGWPAAMQFAAGQILGHKPATVTSRRSRIALVAIRIGALLAGLTQSRGQVAGLAERWVGTFETAGRQVSPTPR